MCLPGSDYADFECSALGRSGLNAHPAPWGASQNTASSFPDAWFTECQRSSHFARHLRPCVCSVRQNRMIGSHPMKYYVRKLLGRFRYEPNIDRSKHKPPLRTTPNLEGHRFLFLAGLHRSGTSVLHRLLRHHPATAGIHDAGVPEDEGQFLQSVFPTGRFFGASGHFAFSPGAHFTEDSDLVSERNKSKLLR